MTKMALFRVGDMIYHLETLYVNRGHDTSRFCKKGLGAVGSPGFLFYLFPKIICILKITAMLHLTMGYVLRNALAGDFTIVQT